MLSLETVTVCFDELRALADKSSNETLHTVLNADGFDDFVQSLNGFVSRKAGRIGQNSSILESNAESVWKLLHFVRLIQENNLPEYVSSLWHLCPLMFSSDRQNYARHLTLHYTQMSMLSETHPMAIGQCCVERFWDKCRSVTGTSLSSTS